MGTPAITSRGFKEEDCVEVAKLIVKVLEKPNDEAVLAEVAAQVKELTDNYPLYKNK